MRSSTRSSAAARASTTSRATARSPSSEIARRLGKRCVALPPALLRGVLAVLHPLGLSHVRSGAGELPALPPGAGQSPAQGGVRLRAEAQLRRGVRAVPQVARPRAALSRAGHGAPSFDGATVLITGAGSGLGRATALAFAAAGARIAALDKDASGLESLRDELETRGRNCLVIPCDMTDATACERAVAAVVQRFGTIDVLVNNAGISHRSGFASTGLDVIRRVMEVNFFGAVNCTKAALPQPGREPRADRRDLQRRRLHAADCPHGLRSEQACDARLLREPAHGARAAGSARDDRVPVIRRDEDRPQRAGRRRAARTPRTGDRWPAADRRGGSRRAAGRAPGPASACC